MASTLEEDLNNCELDDCLFMAESMIHFYFHTWTDLM